MSILDGDIVEDAPGVDGLLARVAAAEAHARRWLHDQIDDLFLPDEHRLDDRTRAEARELLRYLVTTLEADLRTRTVDLLRERNQGKVASLVEGTPLVAGRVTSLLRDPALMSDLFARVREEQIRRAPAAHLGASITLLDRLVQAPDPVVAEAARAARFAEPPRARNSLAHVARALPDALTRRLTWQVAAALRQPTPDIDLDHALAEAVATVIEAGERDLSLDDAVMRLAHAINARPDELPILLIEAIRHRHIALAIALLAHALHLAPEIVRQSMTTPHLWLLLRTVGIDREPLARIGVALAEAYPPLDLDRFVTDLDAVMALDPDQARAATAGLLAHPDLRAASRDLAAATGAQ